jgi:hypothetical protein
MHITEEFDGQSGSAVIDPTLANPSSGQWQASPVTFSLKSDAHAFVVKLDKMQTQRNINPASPGRADFASILTATGLTLDSSGDAAAKADAAATPLRGTVQSAVMTTQSSNMDIDKVLDLMPRISGLADQFKSGDPLSKLTPEQRTQAHDLLGSMRNLVDEVKQTATLQGLSVTYAGHTVSLDKLLYSLAVSAPDGKADTRLRIELAGLQPNLPAAMGGDLIPHRIVLAPSFTGLAADDVFAVLGSLIDTPTPKPDAIAGDVETRLAKAPVTVGIDELAFDVGPAQLNAKGAVTVASPQAIDGTAHVAATGLDALMKLANTDRMLRRAGPVLVFLKGIGATQGDETVWDIAYHDSKLTVNGTDMSAMMPGGK